MKRYTFYIAEPVAIVEAETLEDARKQAHKQLESLSESNDGSEFLANADITMMGIPPQEVD